MGQTLTNGIYLPAEGERNCYEGLAANWTALDGMIGGYNVHISNTTIHVTAEDKAAWNGKADASALTAHTGDTTIHVTAEDKAAWNGKADASALTAHTGDTTIHVTSADKQAWDGHVADSVKHVTAEDKAKWDAVTSKADDRDVVHKSGNETISGKKTFSDLQIVGYGTQYKGSRNAYILPEFAAGYSGLSITTLSFAQTLKIGNFVLDANNKPSLDTSKGYIQIATGENNGVNACILEAKNSTSSLGTSANKWSKIYGTEYYYGANNVEFSTKFVTTDTAQTISGQKVFDDINTISSSSEIGVSGGNRSYKVLDKNKKILARIEGGTYSSGMAYSYWVVNNGTDVFNGISLYQPSANLAQLRPCDSTLSVQLGATNRYFTDCYTSKINALEPSSLSLPSDRSDRIDISSYFTNTGTGQSNSYTVPANGYIYLTLSELTNVHCFSRSSGNVTNYAQTFTKLSNSTGALYILFPVRKNDVFVATWYTTTTTVSVDGAFFIPCKGNI